MPDATPIPANEVPRLTEPVVPSAWEDELAAARLGIRPLQLEVGVTDHPEGPYPWVRYRTRGGIHSQRHRRGVPLVVAAAVALAKARTATASVLSAELLLDERLCQVLAAHHRALPAKLASVVEEVMHTDHPTRRITATGPLARPAPDEYDTRPATATGVGLIEAFRAYARELGLAVVYADGSFVTAPRTAGGWAWWSPSGYRAGGEPVDLRDRYRGLQYADRFELEAIDQAAEDAHPGRALLIVSDSDAAYEVAGGRFTAAGREVTLALATSHVDPYGHNHADRLARTVATEAAACGEPRTKRGVPTPHQLRAR